MKGTSGGNNKHSSIEFEMGYEELRFRNNLDPYRPRFNKLHRFVADCSSKLLSRTSTLFYKYVNKLGRGRLK